MRKVDNSTSQDGADTSSITSAIENEVKKASGLKGKRTSIKRKMPNFSHESDDTVIEPLLQSEKEKTDNSKSAKFLMSKSKTDSGSERSDNVFIETKIDKYSPTSITPSSESIPYTSKVKEASVPKVTAPIHNHMNTNIFVGLEVTKPVPTKSAVIVEIEKTRGSTYTPGPLIFTTAKIHTDSKSKQMEPVQMTPVPILSTIEGSVVKSVTSVIDSGEGSHELIKLKNEIQRKDQQEHVQKSVKSVVSTETCNESMKPKSEIQRKDNQENLQKSTKPVVSTKSSLNLGASSSNTLTNIKTIATSCKDKTITSPITSTVVTPIPLQSFIDKTPLPKDSKIPTTVGKVDILSKTSTSTNDMKILKQDDVRSSIAEKAKKPAAEKSFSGFSSVDPKLDKSTKIGNGKTPVLSGDSKVVSPTDSSVKSEVFLTKDSIVATLSSTDSNNKDKPINVANTLSTNKQLQRQKKATIEDICDPDINVKHLDRGKVDGVALKDQQTETSSKIRISVKTAPDSKLKSTLPSQPLPKTTVDSKITTTSIKPSTAMAIQPSTTMEKSSLGASVPTTLPNIVSSAKTTFTTPKIVSEKEISKDTTKAVGESSKSANAHKSVKKETLPDAKKSIDNKTVPSQSAKLQETAQSAKMSSALKSDSKIASQTRDTQKGAYSSVASTVSSSSGITGKQAGVVGHAVSVPKSSTTSSVNSTVTTTLPSTTSSVKSSVSTTLPSATSNVKSTLSTTLPSTTSSVKSSGSTTLPSTTSSVKSSVSTTLPSTTSSVKNTFSTTLPSTASTVKSPVSTTLPSATSSAKSPVSTTLHSSTSSAKSTTSSTLPSTTSSVKGTVPTTPSTTSSAKALITSNKKINPDFSESNKDSRA